MKSPRKPGTLAIIGTGPSAIFLLHRILNHGEEFREQIGKIVLLEKTSISGTGMPYSPLTTDIHNMSNISSEEIPPLPETLVEWLERQDASALSAMGVGKEEITAEGIYPRLALGQYMREQYLTLLGRLEEQGVEVEEMPDFKVVDVEPGGDARPFTLREDGGGTVNCDQVVISTGHYWNGDDKPEQGLYASPWPIAKLLPEEGEVYNHRVGTLGASLSAFDVVSSLAHRHGKFTESEGELVYRPRPGTEDFAVVMHSLDGMLPYIQFEQDEPMREVFRHVTREKMRSLVDDEGFLRLASYFDEVCRPLFIAAFTEDGMPQMAKALSNPGFGLPDMVEKLSEAHQYRDAFQGMQRELAEAEDDVRQGRVTHWKELLDDLMYTLNFHGHLLPAEDHDVLRGEVLPWVMTVIAAMPLKSARTIIALHAAGKLELIAGKVEILEEPSEDGGTQVEVDDEGEVSRHSYRMFVDCAGQKALSLEDFPFPALVESGSVAEALALYAEPPDDDGEEAAEKRTEHGGRTFLKLGGIAVDTGYRLVRPDGSTVPGAWDMAFPHITGLRPYSYGLQACDETARILLEAMLGDSHKAMDNAAALAG